MLIWAAEDSQALAWEWRSESSQQMESSKTTFEYGWAYLLFLSKLQHGLFTWKTDQTFKKEKVYAKSLIKTLIAFFFSLQHQIPMLFGQQEEYSADVCESSQSFVTKIVTSLLSSQVLAMEHFNSIAFSNQWLSHLPYPSQLISR